MVAKTIELAGQRWVILRERDYKRLATRADAVTPTPALPEPDALGHYPAVEYARASLAGKIIRQRRTAGLTQAALARRARIRPETLNRIEKGKTTPDTATIVKIERALAAVSRQE